MLVIFMVIISSSKKTQASCLRTEIVTQKKAFASFLFKRVFIFIRLVRFGHLYGRLRYVAGLSILFPYVNFLTQSFVQKTHHHHCNVKWSNLILKKITIYVYISICFILCLYLLFSYRRMLRLALSAIFVLSLLKPIEGAAGNSLKVNRLSASICVF